MALWILGCGGEVDGNFEAETAQLLNCGALPDPATCVESERRADENGCRALVCDGWADNPYGQLPGDFYQVLHCDGVRGVNGREGGWELCRDRWK